MLYTEFDIGWAIKGGDRLASIYEIRGNGRLGAHCLESLLCLCHAFGSKWIQLVGDMNGEEPNDAFRYAVSLPTDGKTVAIGSEGYARALIVTNWTNK